MMKLPITIILVLFTQIAVVGKDSGCTDPQYISYVKKDIYFTKNTGFNFALGSEGCDGGSHGGDC